MTPSLKHSRFLSATGTVPVVEEKPMWGLTDSTPRLRWLYAAFLSAISYKGRFTKPSTEKTYMPKKLKEAEESKAGKVS